MMIARNLFRLVKTTPRYFYSTAPPGDAPAFKFPRRWEMQVAAFDEVYDVMGGLTQYQQFSSLLKDNLNYFTDQHMGDMYITFKRLDLQLDNNFYDFILPITKEYIKKYTFQDAESLGKIIEGALALDVQDQQFWELVLKKLHNQKCYRYIDLPRVLQIAQGFLAHRTLNTHPVLQQFGRVLEQQQEFFSLYSHHLHTKAGFISNKISTLAKSRQPQQKLLQQEVKKINNV